MRRSTIVLLLGTMLLFGSVSSAFASTSQNYSIVLPRFQGDVYSSQKTVNAYSDFGVRHKYSGGKTVRFAVCNTSHQQIGSTIAVYPGGSSAPLTDLWYNATASAQAVTVRLDAAQFNIVEILAEGTWVWNY